jgi:regulator of sirC expression with transglutaminase-like and TPR domain
MVLETRLGIPITLSLVYMEVARRAGLPMIGVNLPAHFMCRPATEAVELFVDPFNAGEVLSIEEAGDK